MMESASEYMLQPPAVPMKSPTRFLNVEIPTKGLMGDTPLSPAVAPHDVYLSSEEDVSSCADDFSDFDFESDSEYIPGSPGSNSSRKSCETTARAVSVVFCGKPNIVNLPSPRFRSAASSPTYMTTNAKREFSRTSTEPARPRRSLSVSSGAQPSFFNNFRGNSKGKASPSKPTFLGNDPFAEKDAPATPTLAALKRTFTLSKKQSKPAISISGPIDLLPLRSVSIDMDEYRPPVPARPATAVARGPVKYQDIVTAARQRAIATPPSPELEARAIMSGAKSRLRNGLSLGRKLTTKSSAE